MNYLALAEEALKRYVPSPENVKSCELQKHSCPWPAGSYLVVTSKLLGERIILATDDAVPEPRHNGFPVYRWAELRHVLASGGDSAAIVQTHEIKKAFPGSVVTGGERRVGACV